ncbi:NAD/NADP octopine/nopaline dehydrogenase family protein [Verminephrobacter eiseniae]|uniref:NAD/NADP octopine/nopaline dehydrogenase family protein n=1 Tax=Verminephrobacter eiseniae TaxID=364317 RepID=UPI0010CE97BC|nr:NAD/NADP octopine/nopaline dehydrogenase family protein [Verminephrobacter eiseniae]KAB7609648.1 NAD/NADP octopine/nopaline dehydrogenase [Verminephrobacter sp. Larva24]MCW5234309.1 NAD/NADP octopine/nopaline dehydrogenase [Verminephrobacter eiseniae]MCW5294134.1 NAD/NADP octopine/nopaline dehydrogenase [Verminephrobacter eiseniae]MCW8183714.1 NAD/NADP octopine/nopaline dehydrogenase [Verminephrobacter eiseniae]MCW8221921.1 NAD/NADP octopine/nopaline dehydrogenase [Verminephrobacter eisenia
MKVSILGAGGVAFGTAAFLARAGHDPMLWSPSGKGTEPFEAGAPLVAQGAIELEFLPRVAKDCAQAVHGAEVLLVCLPGFCHKTTMDAVAPHIRDGQTVIISSHISLGALYLSQLLAARGIRATIIAWGTTLITGTRNATCANVVTVRGKMDVATVPERDADRAVELCTRLFGDRFVQRDGLLAIALSNLNPQNHLAIALMNLTRMERGETWGQAENVTPAVGRLIEALDLERLAIAAALGVKVKTVREHFSLSFHVPAAGVSEMNQQMHRNGKGGFGPKTALSRYVLEDVPFGLVATARLGRLVDAPALLHEAGIALFCAAYGRDFSRENDLLPALGMHSLSLEQLKTLAREGAAVH